MDPAWPRKKMSKRFARRSSRPRDSKASDDDTTHRTKKQDEAAAKAPKERTEEEPLSVNQEKKKKSKGKIPALSQAVENALAEFMKHLKEATLDSLAAEHNSVLAIEPAEGTYKEFAKHADKNRFPDIPCLDETRVVLQPPTDAKGTETDYIHANKITVDKADREYFATQAPKDNTAEEFWRMVFQESCPIVVMLCNFYEEGAQKSHEFWPLETGGYTYFGTMFINNKKVDHQDQITVYTIEVLPEGRSNSLICRIFHCNTWAEDLYMPPRTTLKLVQMLKTVEAGPMVVVSSKGTGRAATFIAIDCSINKLFKGHNVKVQDLCKDIRKQRAKSVVLQIQFLYIYSTLANYIKMKAPKYNASVSRFYELIRSITNGDKEKEGK